MSFYSISLTAERIELSDHHLDDHHHLHLLNRDGLLLKKSLLTIVIVVTGEFLTASLRVGVEIGLVEVLKVLELLGLVEDNCLVSSCKTGELLLHRFDLSRLDRTRFRELNLKKVASKQGER